MCIEQLCTHPDVLAPLAREEDGDGHEEVGLIEVPPGYLLAFR
jgi:hypothetical protein